MDTDIRRTVKETRVLPGDEAGVYVICSDEALLENINKILKRKGVIGITDAAGRIHYMIDARNNKARAADDVNSFVVPANGNLFECERRLSEVFGRYGIDKALTGGMILFYIVRKLLLEGEDYHSNMKTYYKNAAEVFNMSYETIERDVRYAVNKSVFPKGARSSKIIKLLADETRKSMGK